MLAQGRYQLFLFPVRALVKRGLVHYIKLNCIKFRRIPK